VPWFTQLLIHANVSNNLKTHIEMKIPKFLIFNFFTKKYLKQMDYFPIPGRRLRSMGTDFSFILSIFFPILLVIMIPTIILTFNNSDSFIYPNLIIGLIPFSIMVFVMINKDFFNGKSAAKRIYGYQIIDLKTNLVASEMQCMTRNLTLIIWPIEVLIALFNPNRRLGDLIAGTKLIDTEKQDPETLIEDMHQLKTGSDFGRLIFLSISFTILFEFLSLLPTLILNG
jgi:uncharacterized RDD family membrane protein YckC